MLVLVHSSNALRADIHLYDAHLYCYQLHDEWFIDLCDPFVKYEFTYAIFVAVLKWAFENDDRK